MPREKMIPKTPIPEKPGLTEFERAAELTRRLIQVRKEDMPTHKKKRKHR